MTDYSTTKNTKSTQEVHKTRRRACEMQKAKKLVVGFLAKLSLPIISSWYFAIFVVPFFNVP
jgi:hypothetical protein